MTAAEHPGTGPRDRTCRGQDLCLGLDRAGPSNHGERVTADHGVSYLDARRVGCASRLTIG